MALGYLLAHFIDCRLKKSLRRASISGDSLLNTDRHAQKNLSAERGKSVLAIFTLLRLIESTLGQRPKFERKGSVRSGTLPLRMVSALAASFSAFFLAATSPAETAPEAMLKKVLLSLIFALDLSFGFVGCGTICNQFVDQQGRPCCQEADLPFNDLAV